jgi:HEAT repeat protein
MLLEKFDSREVALALGDALNDSRRAVREKAAENLWSMGPKAAPAVPALARQMDRKGTYLASVAGSALKAIGTPEAIAEIKKRKIE